MEKPVVLLGRGNPCFSIFSTTCEMLDTADPDNKIFRFKADCKWSTNAHGKPAAASEVRKVNVFTHWSEFDVGACEGKYRVTGVLDAPDGYRAVLEATCKPEVQHVPDEEPEGDTRCEDAIMGALQGGRMSLRDLQRKTHANRYPQWADCLQRLAADGDITIDVVERRTWVTLVTVSPED
jgi:hypothetical protein